MPDPTDRSGDPPASDRRGNDPTGAPDFTPAPDNYPTDADLGSGGRDPFLLDSALLGIAALVLRIPAFLSRRHLTFDDGVFASSVIAMRDGAVPFRDVFSSQGPLFLPLAYLGDLLGFRTLDAPRVLALVSGVTITLVTYWILRAVAGRTAAVFGSLVALTSGCLMWVTGPLAADGPALAFAVISMALAIGYNRRPTLGTAIWMGLAVGATLSSKAMEAPILLPVALVLLAPLWAARRERQLRLSSFADTAAAGGAAVVLFLAVSLPFGFGDVWDQSFRYRTEAAADRDPLANAAKIISTMWDRDLVIWLCGAAVIIWAIWNRRQRVEDPGVGTAGTYPVKERTLIVAWVTFSALWLVFMVSPMWRPHVSAMVPPLALLFGIFRPPRRVIYALAVLALPLLVIQLDGLLSPGPYRGSEAEVVAIIEDLPAGAWVLSDEPGLVWRAGRRTTANMVDPSMLRVEQGRYSSATLAEEAALAQVCAVVVRSDQRFGSFPDLGEKLEAEGYSVVATSRSRVGDDQRVYTKADCVPLN